MYELGMWAELEKAVKKEKEVGESSEFCFWRSRIPQTTQQCRGKGLTALLCYPVVQKDWKSEQKHEGHLLFYTILMRPVLGCCIKFHVQVLNGH